MSSLFTVFVAKHSHCYKLKSPKTLSFPRHKGRNILKMSERFIILNLMESNLLLQMTYGGWNEAVVNK